MANRRRNARWIDVLGSALVLVLAQSCKGHDRESSSPSSPRSELIPVPVPVSASERDADLEIANRNLPCDLVTIQALTPAGSKAVGRYGPITFYSPAITKGGRFEVKTLVRIAERAFFVDALGHRVGAIGREQHTYRDPTAGHWFELRPVTALALATRYWLVIESAGTIRFLQENNAVALAEWRLPFTTANLPRGPTSVDDQSCTRHVL